MADRESVDIQREEFPTAPDTDYDCKMVMLRAERDDTVDVEGYGELVVTARRRCYLGPYLLVYDDEEEQAYELHARDPREQLRLFERVQDDDGFVIHLRDVGEVRAELVDTKQYDICACGEPIKSGEHAQASLLGVGDHG